MYVFPQKFNYPIFTYYSIFITNSAEVDGTTRNVVCKEILTTK